MNKKVIIVGCKGQDGTLLTNLLNKKKYSIYGLSRENFDITSKEKVEEIVKKIKPQEIYFLAAYHHSSEDRKNIDLQLNYDVNFYSVVIFLDSIVKFSRKTKFFFASSSFIFKPSKSKQDETTKFEPECHYSFSKVASMKACDFYRKHEKTFASCGILYNHESSFRQRNFLSKKIITHAIKNFKKSKKKLILHNLNHRADWGYAPDYVNAMHKILNHPSPNDYIISTGKLHSVKDFVDQVYSSLDLDYKKFVEIKENKIISNFRLGNSNLLRKDCNWKPSITFNEMIKKLVTEELDKIK
ncbi:MAG: hypothetical protein CMM99_00765 [Rickettsiales bacterium]|nr:hypothetical protein [Rickettsiales bacterium]